MGLGANPLCNGIQQKNRKQTPINFINNSVSYGIFLTTRRSSQNVAEKKFAARGVRGALPTPIESSLPLKSLYLFMQMAVRQLTGLNKTDSEFPISPTSCERFFLIDGRNCFSIPDVTKVAVVTAVGQKPRPEHSSAFTALVPNAHVDNPVRPTLTKPERQFL